jgi:hypothetical protein
MGNYKSEKNKLQVSGKLKPDEVEFIKYFGVLAQEFTSPMLAKMFGVTKQTVQYHINKAKEEYDKSA